MFFAVTSSILVVNNMSPTQTQAMIDYQTVNLKLALGLSISLVVHKKTCQNQTVSNTMVRCVFCFSRFNSCSKKHATHTTLKPLAIQTLPMIFS